MTLATQAEQAAPEQTRELAEALFKLRFPEIVDRNPIALWAKVDQDWWEFRRMLDIATPEAQLGAAAMLVPDGWDWSVGTQVGTGDGRAAWANLTPGTPAYSAHAEIAWEAASPALALIAAIARAIDADKGDAA